MKNINWLVRIKNKSFWIALIPAVLLLIQVVAAVFGITLDLGDLGNKLLAVVNAVFGVLTILGIVVDPTTSGITGVSEGKSYVFFCGPDTEHIHDAYPYPFGDPYLSDMLPILQSFTKSFDLSYIEVIDVLNDGKAGNVIERRML